jgi:hypothetical protein
LRFIILDYNHINILEYNFGKLKVKTYTENVILYGRGFGAWLEASTNRATTEPPPNESVEN